MLLPPPCSSSPATSSPLLPASGSSPRSVLHYSPHTLLPLFLLFSLSPVPSVPQSLSTPLSRTPPPLSDSALPAIRCSLGTALLAPSPPRLLGYIPHTS